MRFGDNVFSNLDQYLAAFTLIAAFGQSYRAQLGYIKMMADKN
jgi:hypothetical protein